MNYTLFEEEKTCIFIVNNMCGYNVQQMKINQSNGQREIRFVVIIQINQLDSKRHHRTNWWTDDWLVEENRINDWELKVDWRLVKNLHNCYYHHCGSASSVDRYSMALEIVVAVVIEPIARQVVMESIAVDQMVTMLLEW